MDYLSFVSLHFAKLDVDHENQVGMARLLEITLSSPLDLG